MNNFHFDNTLRIKQLAASCHIPPTPPGEEVLQYKIGSVVKSSGLGAYKAGIEIRIIDRWIDNGFAYYRDDAGIVHRTKDIVSS